MIVQHLVGAIEAELATLAVAEMRDHFAPYDAGLAERQESGGKKEAPVHGQAEPLRSMIAVLDDQELPASCRRPQFDPWGRSVEALWRAVCELLHAQCPEEWAAQNSQWGPFSRLTVNRNWATPLHRDAGTRPGSLVALAVVKEGAVTCPTYIEGAGELELESGDLLLFSGADLEHGNISGLEGAGTRWAFVFYAG